MQLIYIYYNELRLLEEFRVNVEIAFYLLKAAPNECKNAFIAYHHETNSFNTTSTRKKSLFHSLSCITFFGGQFRKNAFLILTFKFMRAFVNKFEFAKNCCFLGYF